MYLKSNLNIWIETLTNYNIKNKLNKINFIVISRRGMEKNIKNLIKQTRINKIYLPIGFAANEKECVKQTRFSSENLIVLPTGCPSGFIYISRFGFTESNLEIFFAKCLARCSVCIQRRFFVTLTITHSSFLEDTSSRSFCTHPMHPLPMFKAELIVFKK